MQTDGRTDRQTDIHTYMCIYIYIYCMYIAFTNRGIRLRWMIVNGHTTLGREGDKSSVLVQWVFVSEWAVCDEAEAMRSRWWDIRILCKWSGSSWIMLQPTSLAQSLAGFIAWCLGTLELNSYCKTSSHPSLRWPWRHAIWWRIREGRHSHTSRLFSEANGTTLRNITVPPWCKWNIRKHCSTWIPV